MITAELSEDGRKIVLTDVLQMRDAPRIKSLPGGSWTKRAGWTLPATWVSAVTLRGTFGAELQLGPRLIAWGSRERARVAAVESAHERAVSATNDTAGDPRLYRFQRTGVAFLDAAWDAILGDDLGLGKTVQTAMVLRPGRNLIICPRGVQDAWQDALREWAGLPAHVISGTSTQREKRLATALETGESLIMTYDVLKMHVRRASYGSVAFRRCAECGGAGTVRAASCDVHPRALNDVQWAAVVADEAHKIRDPKSQQTRALWWVGDRAQRRLALTGTPIDKDPSEAWAIWRFVAPDEVPSRVKYIDRWCEKAYSLWGGLDVVGLNPAREPEFRALWGLRFLRRPKTLVAPQLPPLVRSRWVVEMAPAQRKAYLQFAEGLVAEIDGGQLIALNPLTHMTRLGQLAAATCAVDAEGVVTMREPSPKVDGMVEILESLAGAPALVLGASRLLLGLAAARLDKLAVPYAMIVGGMKDAEVAQAKAAYNGGHARVLLLSLGAAAEGLSLTRGATVIVLDRHWRALLNAQGIGRLHGIGRGDHSAPSLNVVDIVAAGTIEETRKLPALAEKEAAIEDFVGDLALMREILTEGL